jgi:hypothetical protein
MPNDVHIVLSDIDGPPPGGGGCQINVDGDSTTGLVTAVNVWNTTQQSYTFQLTVQIGGSQHSQLQTIPPGTGSPQTPVVLTPPFKPGNWTPQIAQNPSNGFWFITNATLTLVSQAPAP